MDHECMYGTLTSSTHLFTNKEPDDHIQRRPDEPHDFRRREKKNSEQGVRQRVRKDVHARRVTEYRM